MGLGANVIIIDPQSEYGRLAETYGGQHIKVSSSSKHRINPLDIEKPADGEENFLTEKILGVLSILEVMLGRKLSARERKILLDSTEETYGKFGITRDKESLDDDSIFDDDTEFFQLDAGKKRMPTLSDLEATLRQRGEEAVDIANELEPFTSGVLSLFNGETNVDLESNFIVFDIKDMEKELSDLAMFIVLEHIWNKVKKNDNKKRLLIVDEAWQLMKNEQSANYLTTAAKQARKFHCGLSIISQQVDDFLNYGGAAIIGNASMSVLLKQSTHDLKKVAEILNLSKSEQGFLRAAGKGEALVFVGDARTAVQVVSHEFEHLLCDTSPGNREIIDQMLNQIQL